MKLKFIPIISGLCDLLSTIKVIMEFALQFSLGVFSSSATIKVIMEFALQFSLGVFSSFLYVYYLAIVTQLLVPYR